MAQTNHNSDSKKTVNFVEKITWSDRK